MLEPSNWVGGQRARQASFQRLHAKPWRKKFSSQFRNQKLRGCIPPRALDSPGANPRCGQQNQACRQGHPDHTAEPVSAARRSEAGPKLTPIGFGRSAAKTAIPAIPAVAFAKGVV